MNKYVVMLCCCFILKKKNKEHFKNKYLVKISHNKINEKDEIIKILLDQNTLLSRLANIHKECYDFVIPLGIDCRCVANLRYCGLLNESTPLDTLHNFNEVDDKYEKICGYMGYEAKINLILNGFADFMDLEDLEPKNYKSGDYTHYVCSNKKTGLIYYHEFDCNTFDKERNIDANKYILTHEIINNMYESTKEKYKYRIARFFNKIEYSKKILLVYIEEIDRIRFLKRHLEKEIIIEKSQELKKMYPNKQINFIFFEHEKKMRENELEKIYLSNDVLLVRSNHNFLVDTFLKNNATIKISKSIHKILSNIKLNDTLF